MSPLNLSLDVRVKERQRDSRQEDPMHKRVPVDALETEGVTWQGTWVAARS